MADAAVLSPGPKGKGAKPPASPRRTLVTPEGVDLGVTVASAGARAGAFLIDLGLMVLAIVLFTLGAGLVAGVFGFARSEFVGVVWVLGFFFLRNGWFIAFELQPAAATPGKRMLRTRVAMRNGARLTAAAVIARNVMRELEIFLPPTILVGLAAGESGWLVLAGFVWTAIFLFFPLFNRDRLRVGDLVAGTWVVEAPQARLLPDLVRTEPASPYAFTDAQVGAYGVMELQVLEQVLRSGAKDTQKAVARRIRTKIDWERIEGETDAAFLAAYYAALRRKLEQGLAFGRRRKDKHDVG